MYNRFIISFSIFFLLAYSVFSQSAQIRGVVIDNETEKPIITAFVFINNTSYGTETDQDGKFVIDCSKDVNGDLIISHINYESITLSFSQIDEIPDTIRLNPEAVLLDEVLVSENKGKNRKKWLRKFKESFLGDDDADEIEILNPDDILFSESDGMFTAIASQPLKINNYRLGYRLRFYLEQFVQTGEQVAYSGKAFFEDMADIEKGAVKEREKEYFQSKRYFLKKLIEESVSPKFYDCHEATLIRPGDYKMTGEFDILNNVYQLYNSGYYVLAVPDALLVNGFGDLKTRNYSYARNNVSAKASFLIPQSKIIIFNRDGVIINFLDVEETGFWASKRILSMLPLDFIPQSEQNGKLRSLEWVPLGFIANTIYADDPISSRLKKEGMLINPIDLFLHADRSVYLPGETIWFSLFGKRNKGKALGNYGVGIELRNQLNETEIFKIVPLNDGLGSGFLTLPDSLKAGDYLLRYYLVNNEIESIYNEIGISLIDSNREISDTENAAITEELDSIYIRFFPEGGVLVHGLESKVAFEVTDKKGNYLDFTGELLAEHSGNTLPIKTLYNGMGYLQLVPLNNEQYHLQTSVHSRSLLYQFPKVVDKGGVISASTKLKDAIKIGVQTNDDSPSYRLLGHSNGVVFSDHEFYDDQEVFLFNKSNVPTGVLHFTLFNDANTPLAERLVFNDHGFNEDKLEVTPRNSFFRKKSQVNLDVSADQLSSNDSLAFLSISVTDDNLYDPKASHPDILSEWYVNNRLDHVIPDLSKLLEQVGHKERFVMDLYMMVRGWRRFDWDQLDLIENQVNQGINITGEVASNQSELKIVLTNFSNPFYYDEQEVKSGPYFNFSSVPVASGSNFILQLKDKESDKLVNTGKGKLILDSITPTSIDRRYNFQKESNSLMNYQSLINNEIKKQNQDSLLEFSFNVDLDEVLIKEKRERDMRVYGLTDLSKLDWVDPRTPPRALISRMRPSARVLNSVTGRLQFEITDDQGFRRRVNAIIQIDGQIHYDGSRYLSLAKFNSLTADQILYYGVNPPFITIYTDPNGPRSLQNQETNLYNYTLPGTEDYKEFYKPVYDAGDPAPDFRTTIHWQPVIVVTKGKKVNINFYSGDEDATYTYVLQGMTSKGKPIYKKGSIEIKE